MHSASGSPIKCGCCAPFRDLILRDRFDTPARMPVPTDFEHPALTNVYSLSVPVRPGSVRDSIWRAESLCALIPKLPLGARVLVVGRGPSGMAAALTLLERGYEVLMCERPPVPGGLRACTTRTICPTTFDFPVDHWTVRAYPPNANSGAVLPWRFGLARDVSNALSGSFNARARAYQRAGKFDVHDPGDLLDAQPSTSGYEVTIITAIGGATTAVTEPVGAILVCTGPGQEKGPGIGRFASYGFFDNKDPLILEPANHPNEKVLIIGAGDGGLGDFVRLKTNYVDVFDLLSDIPLPAEKLDELREIHRSLWAQLSDTSATVDRHIVLTGVQEQLVGLVDALWNDDSLRVRSVVQSILKRAGRTPSVQIVFPCYHFDAAYFSNRLLAQLVARALADNLQLNGGLRPFRVGARCARLEGHNCQHSAQDCSATPHLVIFERATCDNARVEIPSYVLRCHPRRAEERWKATTSGNRRPMLFDRILFRGGGDFRSFVSPTAIASGFTKRRPIWDPPPLSL